MGNIRTWGNDTTVGVLLLLVSALGFSTAGLFTRLAPVALAPMVVWRNVFGCVGLAALLVLRCRKDGSGARAFSLRGWTAMMGSAFATVCYLAAFGRTSVANISIIYAAAPTIAAALAWLSLDERPTRRTLLAAVMALAGVAITVGGSASTGTLVGDGLALLMTVALSAVAVLARGSVLPPLETACGSAFLAAVAVLPVAMSKPWSLVVGAHDAIWLGVFGLVTLTIALPAYLAGAARVPAGRTMLISSVELPFAPFWVWLTFGEVPPVTSMVGGAIVLAAVLCDVVNVPVSRERGAEAPL